MRETDKNALKRLKNKKKWEKALQEAQKNPNFKKELNKFIKITSGVYKLKDYGLE